MHERLLVQPENVFKGGKQFQFVSKRVVTNLTGLSDSTLKRYRLSNKLVEGIHWIKINSRTIRYNADLILDWLKNIDDPESHARAVSVYLNSLPSRRSEM